MVTSPITDTVLVVDDDPFQLKLISRQLAAQGIDATCFLSGVEALAHLHGQSGGNVLILLDLDMPGMDGVEFIRKLVDCRFGGAVAFLSGQERRILESAGRLVKAHNLRFMGALDKPVANESIAAVLSRWRMQESTSERQIPKEYTPEELGRAIVNNELVNHYQPKVNLSDGVVSGVETLVRWQHPEDGLVYPDQFIGIAEGSGLIDDLTRSVLAGALEQAKVWHDQGKVLQIAVNVSMENLKEIDFPDYVQSELQRTGVNPTSLILEITESRLTEDSRLPLDILTRLRLKNVSLSIDDFGTGHSSLSKLRDLPFDELKIDRSFIHGAGSSGTLRGIFQASLAMAKQLNMKVVAEGAEDQDDWEFLRVSGCNTVQGYFVAKPMPASEFSFWSADWKSRRRALYPS